MTPELAGAVAGQRAREVVVALNTFGCETRLSNKGAMPRHRLGLAIVVLAVSILATSAFAASTRPKTGRYAGRTSEGNAVALRVTDHGRRITGFTTVDGYNMKCHFTGTPPHIFHFTVKVAAMRIKANGSFGHTVKAKKGPFTGTFTVKGRFSAGKARGTVTRIGATCGSGASNPTTSDYLETFTAKRS
jgi:hypothetical protein